MKIFEVKNNLVKIFYDSGDNLFLSSFLMIKDTKETYIAQVMHLESNKNGNLAVLKLIFNVTPEGIITNYKGSIPTIKSIISIIKYEDFLKLIEGKHPIIVGETTEGNVQLILDKSLLENKLVVCCEKQSSTDLLIKRLNEQIKQYRKKTVIIDIDGDIEITNNIIVATENFKLPITPSSLDFIYEKVSQEISDAKSKAIIQEIIMELQYYAQTVPDKFIPINYFIDLLETQYTETGIAELVLLKNEILKYHDAGVFAQEKREFQNLVPSLIQDETTVINLAYIDEDIQKEYISYLYTSMQELNSDFYVFLKLANHNSTKKLLKQIYASPKINTSIICPYSYKYLNELKKISKNLILFTPILQQEDFASYNTFLNKLGKNEFVIYGKTTQYVPLIAKISSMKGTFTKGLTPEKTEETDVHMQEQMKEYLKAQEEEKQKKLEEDKQNQEAQEQARQQQQMMMQQLMQHQQQQQQQMQMMMPQYVQQPFIQMPFMMPQIIQQPYVQMPMQQIIQPQVMPQVQQIQPPEQPQATNDSPVLQAIEPQPMPVEEEEEEEEEENYTLQETDVKQSTETQQTQLTEADLDLIENVDLYEDVIEQPVQTLSPESDYDPMREAFERQQIDDLIESENISENAEPQTQTIQELTPQEILQQSLNDEDDLLHSGNLSNPILPAYSEITEEADDEPEEIIPIFEKGQKVSHEAFGTGVIEKIINYGSKQLYSIYFEQVGRRLLDPKISNLTRAD